LPHPGQAKCPHAFLLHDVANVNKVIPTELF
jgi:hypothetical protein